MTTRALTLKLELVSIKPQNINPKVPLYSRGVMTMQFVEAVKN